MTEKNRIHVMDEADVRRAIARMAREIVEQNGGTEALTLMGIHRRGVHISALLKEEIERAEDITVSSGSLDITMYRDDLMAIGPRPVVGETKLPPEGVDDRNIVIVDDVLYTGRTTRAALNELTDWGRPRRIHLCVVVDRGGRELPIQPDIVGREVPILPHQRIEVLVPDLDGRLGVEITNLESEDA
jgi:pyrimidine operon attenuation protein / uracil phosphoribosyltransferase